ncbi:MAG: hypothetical protein HC913_13205 [Microscillaceae bacterium]|nr:hypothetical protein [Microscillaceae bacterium]
MIQEIINFVKHISQNDKAVFARNLQLREGIYILLDIEKQGENFELLNEKEIFDSKEDILVYDGKSEDDKKTEWLNIITNTKPTSAAKIFNPNKKIYNSTCSGFALGFNKKNYADKDENLLIQEVAQYFQSAEKYIEKNNTEHQVWFHNFKGFCLNRLGFLLWKTYKNTEKQKRTPISFYF